MISGVIVRKRDVTVPSPDEVLPVSDRGGWDFRGGLVPRIGWVFGHEFKKPKNAENITDFP